MASAAERAAAVWSFRARAEIDAAQRFDDLSRRLDEHGGHAKVLELSRQAAADERRHAQLCTLLIDTLGGTPPPLEAPRPRRVGPRGLSERERLLYEIVAMSCITETISTAVLGLMRDAIEHPVFREAVSEILKDEVGHSRLGWAHLQAELPRGPANFIADHLDHMLAATVSEELFAPAREEELAFEAELAGYGALGKDARREAFAATLDQVIFPGLEAMNIDTARGRAWLAKHHQGAAKGPE